MKTLFLAPHNDDESLFGAFTLLREQPHVIVCLRSERMGTPGYPPPLIDHETREQETEQAMNVLGIEWEQWPELDSAPDWNALRACLRAWDDPDAEGRMDRVFAPAIEDGGHGHHNRIGEIALDVFGDRVTGYLSYTDGTTRSRNGTPVPYDTDWPDLKRAALACYRSQIEHPMTGHHFAAPLDEFYA